MNRLVVILILLGILVLPISVQAEIQDYKNSEVNFELIAQSQSASGIEYPQATSRSEINSLKYLWVLFLPFVLLLGADIFKRWKKTDTKDYYSSGYQTTFQRIRKPKKRPDKVKTDRDLMVNSKSASS